MIEVIHQDGIAVLRMADGKANAMSLEFCRDVTARLKGVEASPAPAVVISGERRIFSAGVDLLRLLDGGVPYIREFKVEAKPGQKTVYRPIESFGKVYMQADAWHTNALGYELIAKALIEELKKIDKFRRCVHP